MSDALLDDARNQNFLVVECTSAMAEDMFRGFLAPISLAAIQS